MPAQACGTAESTALLPGIIAQPPFSTYVACSHTLAFFSSVRLLAAAALRLELVDADRRYRRNHRAIGRAVRQRLPRASKHPPAPAEADDESREDADGGALKEPLQRFSLVPSRC